MGTTTGRGPGRATLARQHLLARTDVAAERLVGHLVGLQAQTPHSWYVGLWSRLAPFDPLAVGAALVDRRLVRLPLMRNTVHLVPAADARFLRPLLDPVLARGAFVRELAGVDPAAVAAAARELVDDTPRTAAELGRALAARFPGHDPVALTHGARAWLPMVQVPPRGVWGRSGQARQAALDTWLTGPEPEPDDRAAAPLHRLVRRYLAAFGPASVRDVQTWCGLTRLAEVVDALRGELVVLPGPDGAELLDLPDAPRPDPDTPAPVRFLYDYDNLLLSHADRTRFLPADTDPTRAEHAARNVAPAWVLVDGVASATWRAARIGDTAVLDVHPVRPLAAADRAGVAAEGTALLAFLHPGRTPDVRLHAPP